MRLTFHTPIPLLLCVLVEGCGDGSAVQTDAELGQLAPPDALMSLNAMPEGFPAEVPIYPETTLRRGRRTETGFNVSLLTRDDFDRVTAYYRDQFRQGGWAVVTDDETEASGKRQLRLVAESNSLKCTVDIAPGVGADGQVRVHGVTIYVKEKARAR